MERGSLPARLAGLGKDFIECGHRSPEQALRESKYADAYHTTDVPRLVTVQMFEALRNLRKD